MRIKIILMPLLMMVCLSSLAQNEKDSLPRPIPFALSSGLFVPAARLVGFQPWVFAPMVRPLVYYTDAVGFNGSEGFGEYFQQHPDRFFSTMEGMNDINLPHLYVTRQRMIGNTMRLRRNGKVYFLSGILFGSQMGVMGNNWGMGTREGLLIRIGDNLKLVVWNQYFQSVSVYSPVVIPDASGDGAAIMMPATPEVFSVGVQASFVSGVFVIDLGVSVTPLPFGRRRHSEFRYR